MLAILHHFEVHETSHLLFILSCHRDFTPSLVSSELLLILLRYLYVTEQPLGNKNITYIYRFLANCYSKEIYQKVLDYFVERESVAPITSLFGNESMLWFLGNAHKLCSDHEFFNMLLMKWLYWVLKNFFFISQHTFTLQTLKYRIEHHLCQLIQTNSDFSPK